MLNTSGENAHIHYIQSLNWEPVSEPVSSLTSVTMVLWKFSVLYSQPPWQLPEGCPSPTATAWLWFKEVVQDSSRQRLGSDRTLKLKFEEAVSAEGLVEWHKWGGTAPVNTETSMWNARKIWGKQIHIYKIFWNFPKPPIRLRISSKFISLALWGETLKKCAALDGIRSDSEGPTVLPKMLKPMKANVWDKRLKWVSVQGWWLTGREGVLIHMQSHLCCAPVWATCGYV